MRRAVLMSAVTLALIGAAPAAAQEGPEVGGIVEGVLRLELEETPSLAAFPAAAGTAEASLRATIVATDGPVALSVADGGGTALAAPLEAAAADGPFGPLGAEPVLREWSREIGVTTTVVRLRQRVSAGELRRGAYARTVLVTATVGGP